MAYATVADLEARWRTLTSDEQVRATVLLDDAAVRIDAACPFLPLDPPTAEDASKLAARKIVSCEMVKRAMASVGGVGVESLQQGAGPYQETVKYTNPTGDLYLTKADRTLLGCGAPVAFTIPMGSPVVVAPELWEPLL
jgi:hypothetical protein